MADANQNDDGRTDDEQVGQKVHSESQKERDAIRDVGRDNGLFDLVFYGSEPWIALVNRDKSPSSSHPRPAERIAVIEWESDKVGYVDDGWAVSITQATDRPTHPEWEMPEDPDKTFDHREEAVKYAAKNLSDSE